MEEIAQDTEKSLNELSFEEWDNLWKQAKKETEGEY